MTKTLYWQIDERLLWHRRMGHMKFENLVKINTEQAVKDMSKNTKPSNTISHGKKTRVSFKSKGFSTPNPLKLIHTDLCGPIRT